MSDFKNSLAYLIANQVPDYIRDEFPQFVLFLEKYYEFLDQDGEVNSVLLNASSFSDINKTLEQFLPSFREQYLQMFPTNSLVDDRRLIKFIRDFYEGKGSEESIKFIFRTFFDADVDIIYPSQYILKASDGIWVNRTKMRITTDETISLDPFDLAGKKAKIYSYRNVGSISVFDEHDITVEEVNKLGYSVEPTYELFVTHNENDTIILPGAGAAARPLIVDGEIVALSGDPEVKSHYFDPNIDIGYGRIFLENHGFTTGDCVIYDPMGNSEIQGLIPYRQYFVKVLDANYFQVYRDRIALSQIPSKQFISSSNIDVVYNTITLANHGYRTGDMITYRADASAIGGLVDGKVYYIIKIDNDTFKLAESLFDSDPRYCLDDTYFAEDYVVASVYNEIDLTSIGSGDYHVLSKEFFVNFTDVGSGIEQRFIDSMDARGSGYNALPTVMFISDIGGIGATATAHLDDEGGIDYVSMNTGGTGYDVASTIIEFNTDNIRSFIFIDTIENKYGYVSRSITDTVDIVGISGSPNYGFVAGEIYSISESGSTGQYVYTFLDTNLNYFAGDYVQFGVDNKASVIIDAVDEDGKPTKVRIFSTGSGFLSEKFTTQITSSTGSICVLGFTTGAITSIQDGYQNRQGMLSDVNKLQDNYYYQNYSYTLRSRIPSTNWYTMIKNTVHPAGMAVFGELLVRSTINLGASFEVVRQPIHFYEFPVETVNALDANIGIEYHVAVEFIKSVIDTYTTTDSHISHVGKVTTDTVNNLSDAVVNSVGKQSTDVTNTNDNIDFVDFDKVLIDTPALNDQIYFGFLRTTQDSFIVDDAPISHIFKNLDGIDTGEFVSNVSDLSVIETGKNVSDVLTSGDSIPLFTISKTLADTVIATETLNEISPVVSLPDTPVISDNTATNFNKIIADGITASDSLLITSDKNIVESIPHGVNEDLNLDIPGKTSQSILHTMEHSYTETNKNLSETTNTTDFGVINTQDYWSYDFTSGAYGTGDYVGNNSSI